MKKIFILVIGLITAIAITSCGSTESVPVKKAGQDTIIYNVSNEVHDSHLVETHLEKHTDVAEFCKEFHVSNYKQCENLLYTVINTDDGLKLVTFDVSEKINGIRNISFSPDNNEADLKNIQKGDSLSMVMEADSKGQYAFLYSGWSDYPKFSFHYFTNGFCYEFQYGDDNTVINAELYTI